MGVAANLLWGGSPGLEKFIRYGTEPAGQLWLRALMMIVVPLVFATLSAGVAELPALRELGRMGLKTLGFFVLTATLAAVLGVSLGGAFHPGSGLGRATCDRLLETYRQESEKSIAQPAPSRQGGTGLTRVSPGIPTLINLVPSNPIAAAAQGDMLGLIFFSLILGVALALVPRQRVEVLLGALRGLAEVMSVVIDLVMKLAPYGIFALMFSVAARFGLDLLSKLAAYVLTVVAGLLVFEFGVYPLLVWGLAGRNPRDFFQRARLAIATAFSTSSSNATLPTTLRVSETELAIPRNVCGFVLPLGASMNKNGSAIFEAVSVLFIAQALGMPLGISGLTIVVVMTVLTAGLSNVGVPSAIIPLTVTVLEAVGLPGEGIALVIGMDRLLDMCRTAVNVTGHMVAAAFVSR
jgi:DAACS family dicarboxylate/amino acid:cation (Na+ or H+) symporter